jgi:cell division protein FtsQ
VQSVGPNGGRRQKRRSDAALLARAIAVPPKRFAGLKLPGFGKKAPGGAALVRGGKTWRVVTVLLLASAAGYGFWISGEEGLYGQTKRGLETLTIAAGFGVKRIAIEGQQHVTDAELTRALGAGPGSFIFAFDTDAAKQRLEQVPWVKRAQVMRLLPSTLQVVIEERVPFAVWQSRGQTYAVDAEGAVIAPAVREAYADLPLVVGEGAGKNAADLFEALKPFNSVTRQMIAALRVGDRRWTLKLSSGIDVLLPDAGVDDALKTLIALESERSLLEREIAAVDLRLADRVSVRIRDKAEMTMPGNGSAVPETPTSSTKRNT